MNKILIGIGVVLSAYLIYSSMDNEEGKAPAVSETVISNQENVADTFVAEPEDVYDNKSATIEGRYVLNITTDTTETSQVFIFNSNRTFELNRSMISPNPALAGEIVGTYTIVGNTINLVFPDDRDKDTFSVDTAEMIIKSETELEYGGFIAHLD